MSTNANMARRKGQNDRQHKTQSEYVLLVIFALSVITLALVLAILFTQSRLGDVGSDENALRSIIAELTIKPEVELNSEELEAMNYWPSDLFPSVPQFEAGRYQTVVDNMRAVITIPAEDVLNLQAYVTGLTAAGASLYVNSDTLIVLVQAGTEIQIVPTGARPTITLCGEQQISWQNGNYPDMRLPETGKLVAVKDGLTPDSLVFTYRNASISDAMVYLNELNAAGWQSMSKLNYKSNTLLASFHKNGYKLTVDYYAGGDNYQIKLEKEIAAEDEAVS